MYPISSQRRQRINPPLREASINGTYYPPPPGSPPSPDDHSSRRVSPILRDDSANESYSAPASVNPNSQKSQLNQANTTNGVRVTRFVIGLDFGTTYTGNYLDIAGLYEGTDLSHTGIAYATPSGTRCSLDEITPITDWGADMKNHKKVPSIISYTKSAGGSFQQWGSSLSPNAVTTVHKKLELGPQPLQGELDLVVQILEGMKDLHFGDIVLADEDNEIPAYACKSPEEIVTDYLTKVFGYLDLTVEEFKPSFRKHTITDLVITIPTVCCSSITMHVIHD